MASITICDICGAKTPRLRLTVESDPPPPGAGAFGLPRILVRGDVCEGCADTKTIGQLREVIETSTRNV